MPLPLLAEAELSAFTIGKNPPVKPFFEMKMQVGFSNIQAIKSLSAILMDDKLDITFCPHWKATLFY